MSVCGNILEKDFDANVFSNLGIDQVSMQAVIYIRATYQSVGV